jgi:hypothetical protein
MMIYLHLYQVFFKGGRGYRMAQHHGQQLYGHIWMADGYCQAKILALTGDVGTCLD